MVWLAVLDSKAASNRAKKGEKSGAGGVGHPERPSCRDGVASSHHSGPVQSRFREDRPGEPLVSPTEPGPASDDRFRILFERSSDGHLISDVTGITDCNDAAIRLLGAPDRSAVLAVHPATLSPEFQPDGRRSDEKAREMEATARANGSHRFEWVRQRLDGTPVPVEVTLNPVEIAGRPAMIAVWHDLTAIKRAEAELRRRADELQAANDRLRRDLRAAARVQQAFLPAALPDTGPVRVGWAFRPCEELGGDLLNLFPVGDRHLGLYLLDVSGHGVPASLLAVAVGHALNPHGDAALLRRPAEVVRRVNGRLCGDRTEQFVTLFYGVLDTVSGVLTYANAGHPRPVLLSPGDEPVLLPEGGLPAGVTADAEYREAAVRLRPGDRLWVYSDGLPEAMAPGGEAFGEGRLTAAFRTAAGLPLEDAVRGVVAEAEGWAGPCGPQDDVSVVALESADPTCPAARRSFGGSKSSARPTGTVPTRTGSPH